MSLTQFHGSRVTQDANGPILIQTQQSAVGALILADATIDTTVFPYNTPILIKGTQDYLSVRKLGNSQKHVDAIFNQIATYVYIVNVAVGMSDAATMSNIIGSRSARTGMYALLKCEGMYGRQFKPRLVAVPDHTAVLSTTGVSSITATAGGGSYSSATTCQIGDGTGAQATPIIVAGVITGFVVTKPWFGYDPSSAPSVTIHDPASTGTGATATAHIGTSANPVVSELTGLLPTLRAVAFCTIATTTRTDAIAARNTFNSNRIMPIYVRPEVWSTSDSADVPQDAAPFFIGAQAYRDSVEGFQRSVSNTIINGIDGVEDQVSYGDDANLLNFNGISTIISGDNGGYLCWGNRTASDPTQLNVFLSVQRTTDFINEAVESAFRRMNDAPMTPRNVKRLIQAGNDYMRTLANAGAIYQGQVYVDPTQNTDTQLGSGQINLAMKFLVPPPMEDIETVQAYEITWFSVLRDAVLSSTNLTVTSVIGLT